MQHQISWSQLMLMTVAGKLSLLVTYGVALVGRLPPTRDTWLSVLFAASMGFLIALFPYALSLRFPGKSFNEYLPIVFGKPFGVVVNLILAALFIHWAAISLRQFSYFLDSVVYLRTPEYVFSIAFLILAYIATREGPEFIARVATLAGVVTIGGIVFFMLVVLPQVDFGMVRPFLAEGWWAVIDQGLTPFGLFAEAAWIAWVAVPYLSRMRDAAKALSLGTLINGSFAALSAILVIGILGTDLIGIVAFPTHTAARVATLGRVFERLDWVILVMWVGAMGVRVSIVTLGAMLGLRGVLPKVRPERVTLLVILAVLIWSQFILGSLTEVLNFFAPEVYLAHALPLQLAPALILLVAWLRKKRTGELPNGA